MGDLKPLVEPATAESIVAKKGTTTTNGAVDGSTVVDAGLTEADDYWNDMTILILSGASDGQSRDITGFTGGILTVSPVFASRILSGVRYFILPFKPSAAEVEDLKGTGFVKDTDSLVDLSHEAGAKGTDNISDHLGYEGALSLADKLTLARAGFLNNINNANLATIADISSLTATEIGYLANINNANLATIADISSLTATEIGYLAELAAANIPSDVDDIKAKTDNLPGANTDESGSFTWVTLTHTTNEGDISALFTTPLTGATRRRYAVFVDLTGCEADGAAWTTCTVRVKIGFGVGDAYRTVDLKEIAKTDVAAAKEPGINIDIPATAKNVQITLQFDVQLAADATIYYSYVKESLE